MSFVSRSLGIRIPTGLFWPAVCSAQRCSTTHAEDHERQQIVQREEAVQRRVVDRRAAAQPDQDRLADQRDGPDQVGDDLGAPVGHLAPRQDVAQEGRGDHQEEDHAAQDPDHLARRLVGAVVEAAQHVDVDGHEEHRRAVGVDVADQPAAVDVAHDALDRGEGHRRVRHDSAWPGRCRWRSG